MLTTLQAATIEQYGYGMGSEAEARRSAVKQFEKALSRGRRWQVLARLTRQDTRLKVLAATPANSARRTSATCLVSLKQIVGSESRSEDFDARFNPLHTHNQERWLGIAAARRMAVALPPVELVQVGAEYYVRDGHHRISVARAMGQMEIEAVIVN